VVDKPIRGKTGGCKRKVTAIKRKHLPLGQCYNDA
jgi:hypothetical protein